MAKKKDDSQIKYFIEDANFFTLWVFATPAYHPKEYFGLHDINPLRTWDYKRTFDFLKARCKMAAVTFPKVGNYSDTPDTEVKPITTEELGKEPDEYKKKVQDAYSHFRDNKFTLEELDLVAEHRYKALRWTYIQPSFSQDDVKKFKKQMDEYITDFLNNELFVYDRNYFVFEKQKETFISMVRKMKALEEFGENFIISSDAEIEAEDRGDGFLFVHTLYALQKLGYIIVLRLWHEKHGYGGEDKEDATYYANVVALDPLIEEINTNFRKENPTKTYEGYDEKHNALKVAGKSITLSKKNKETDAVLLMKTLKKDTERYWHNDEVIEDWGYKSHDETAKNKAYFAARKINDAVKMATGIEDFIDHNTTKFRINPKYLKVDK